MKHSVEHIQRSGGMLTKLHPEDPIGKRYLDIGIMAESKGQGGFAKAASTTQRRCDRRRLTPLLIEKQTLDFVKGFWTRHISLGEIAGLKEEATNRRRRLLPQYTS